MLKLKVNTKKLELRLHKIDKGLRNLKNTLMSPIGKWIDRAKTKQFNNSGGLYGRSKWPRIKPSMYGKLRYGTTGHSTGLRYSSSDKPLIVSGAYMNSFKLYGVQNNKLTYGSRLQGAGSTNLAKDIQYAGRGNRFVLPVWFAPTTQSETRPILKRFLNFLLGRK